MKKGGVGGGRTTTGLEYEGKVDLATALSQIDGYEIRNEKSKAGLLVLYSGNIVARLFKKNDFYRYLDECKVAWKGTISKKLLPDDALLVIVRETLYIIEVKYQQVAGSVDEKLQTCDFKRKQYLKLVLPIGLKVEYVYVLSVFFKQPSYKDVLDYIHSVNCHYRFGELPLSWLGLPTGNIEKDLDLIVE